ncbi:tetratricopeptide repeat protein [Aurantibacillus circumpalustris]|uniref:tetratricopeptide repeat protein n=1 Tax=Aurantibacillus circumpalustris TaxID=3036359 RepID=UPI00295AF8C8|nr:tetratricopeptide repeat protein [Aurantibacillus circumpalustris]
MRIQVASIILISFFLVFVSCTDNTKKEESEQNKVVKSDSNQRLAKNFLTDCKNMLNAARKADSILLNETEVNTVSANKAIKAFTDFAFYCQSDTMCPIYLIKTAQVARAINNIPQAKVALDQCINMYPNFKNRPAALFLLAQLYDENTYLNNEAEARKIYEEIINEYPKSDWALSAKGAISFIGKSDEEILRELKKKQKK